MTTQPEATPVRMLAEQLTDLRQLLLTQSAALNEQRFCHRHQPGRGQEKSPVPNRVFFPTERVHWVLTCELSAVFSPGRQKLCQHHWPKNILPRVQKQSW